MRRPRIHEIFQLSGEKGLSNILAGDCNVTEAVAHTRIPNLDTIICGPIPPNPSELLGSSRMTRLLDILRKHYARIIIDSSPIAAVTDAVILVRFADGIVLVVRAGETPREIVKNGLGQLQAVNGRILGAVLNGVDMGMDSHYYYHQYYYYYHGEDGERREKARSKRRSKSRYGKGV
jgi:capsular exopolysaccharide synthesis family protein